MRAFALLALVACSTPTAPISHHATPVPGGTRMGDLPGLELYKPETAARDCRLSTVLRAKWGAQVVTPCGTYHAGKPGPTQQAQDCAVKELAAGRPFMIEMTGQGDDSTFGRGYVAVVEHGSLTTYAAFYDDDPCGGSCADRGHTTLMRCKSLAVLPGCNATIDLCLDCTEGVEIEKCTFGKR